MQLHLEQVWTRMMMQLMMIVVGVVDHLLWFLVFARIVIQLRVYLQKFHFMTSTITVNHLIVDKTILINAYSCHY